MSELSNNTDNILSNFPPCLRKNIEELCLRSTIGFLSLSLDDIDITHNNYSRAENVLNNFHFILKVPYAGKKLKWEVIFDPEDFYFAPDFDFNDEAFLSFIDIETLSENVSTWKNWSLKNPKALAQVLNELLSIYKKYQIDKLNLENIYSRYAEEYKTLISKEEGIKAENVQICVEGSNIIFLIFLKLDCSTLPEYVHPVVYKGNNFSEHTLFNQGDDFCHLKVSISKSDGSRTNYSIQLSPRLEQVLGNFKFSNADFKKDNSLIEIVTSVSGILERRLQQIANHHKLKKIYIMNIAASYFKTIIEYDVLNFNKAVLLHIIDDYHCLVTINIGVRFPQEKPTVTLTSVYCQETTSCCCTIDKYPYSPGVTPELNVKHLMEYLHNAVLEFKTHKH